MYENNNDEPQITGISDKNGIQELSHKRQRPLRSSRMKAKAMGKGERQSKGVLGSPSPNADRYLR
jgi:hypothetical protein